MQVQGLELLLQKIEAGCATADSTHTTSGCKIQWLVAPESTLQADFDRLRQQVNEQWDEIARVRKDNDDWVLDIFFQRNGLQGPLNVMTSQWF